MKEGQKKPMRDTGPRKGPLKKALNQMDPITVDYTCQKLKAARGGHIGLRQKNECIDYDLEYFHKQQFEVIEWDGK